MNLQWYNCSYCGLTIKQSNTPNQGKCSAQNSSHYWHRLGEAGDDNYECKDCGIVVQTQSKPQQGGCPKSVSHYWKKL